MIQVDINWVAIVGIVGALCTLSGVLITNYYNFRQHKEKLRAEAIQKEKDRIFTLRRDIYLSAGEQFIKFNVTIASLIHPNSDIEKSTNEFNTFCSSLYKLQLVSDIELSMLVGDILNQYTELFLGLLNDSKELAMNKAELKIKEELVSNFRKEVSNIIEKLKINMLEGNFSESKDRFYNEEMQAYEVKILELDKENENLHLKIGRDTERLGAKTFLEIHEIRKRNIKFDVFLRRDVCGENGLEEYETYSLSLIKDADEKVKKYIAMIGTH